MIPRDPQPGNASAVRMFSRAARRRCPRCGLGGIFTGWSALADRCPHCDLDFEHEEGYWTGAILVNLTVTMGVFVAAFVGFMVLTWPDVPYGWLMAVVVAASIVTPVVFYPFSKTLWIAADLSFRKMDRPPGERR